MNKVDKRLFFTVSNEVVWLPKNSNFMHEFQSAILAIFQKSANWLDWPCPVSAALQNRPQDFFSLKHLHFNLFFQV